MQTLSIFCKFYNITCIGMGTGQWPVWLSALPADRPAGTCVGRRNCWQGRQPNRPLSDSPVQTSIELARPDCSPAEQAVRPGRTRGSAGEQTVQNIHKKYREAKQRPGQDIHGLIRYLEELKAQMVLQIDPSIVVCTYQASRLLSSVPISDLLFQRYSCTALLFLLLIQCAESCLLHALHLCFIYSCVASCFFFHVSARLHSFMHCILLPLLCIN